MEGYFNIGRYRDLVRKAIGQRTQKEFAEAASLSQYHLSNLMTKDTMGVPRKATIEKIAEASQGRVTFEQLADACGYAGTAKQDVFTEDMSAEDKNLAFADLIKDAVSRMAGSAVKYASVEDMLDSAVTSVGLHKAMVKLCGEDAEYTGVGRKGAERCVNVEIKWCIEGKDAVLAVEVFYCRTAGGGVIVSDCAFDMDTLVGSSHPVAGRLLFKLSESGDVCYGDYPVVVWIRDHVPGEAERRLLKAIFGEDFKG